MQKRLTIFFIATLVMLLIMQWQGRALQTELTPSGILDLEFAGSEQRLQQIKTVWEPGDFYFNTVLDFFFLISYSGFLYFACMFTAKRWGRAGRIFAQASLLAGVLDALENCSIMVAFSNGGLFFIQSAYYLAFFKFLFAGLVIFYLVLSIPFILKRKSDEHETSG